MSAMAEQVTFAVQRRTAFGKAASKLRRQGIIPGNIYGGGRESIAIQLNGLDFQRFLAKHSATTLLRLQLGDGAKDETVVVRHVEREPATHAIQHVDFLHVELSQAMRARLPLHLTGDAPAVRLYGGVLLTLLDHIEVEARPTDLPKALTLDVSGLEELKATLHVRDIAAPESVKVLTNADEPVVKIEPPRVVEEEVAPAAAAASEGATAAAEEEATSEAGS
jgi:large subunit ribosomal protein L25